MVKVRIIRAGPVAAPLPAYQSSGASGMDLCAALAEPVTLAPGARRLIPTGWAIALPERHEAQVRPRSGLALKHGITVLNSPGSIDSDFRGEIGVVLINHGQEPFQIDPGARIAQLVIARCERAILEPCDALDDTPRGAGGYGSTG